MKKVIAFALAFVFCLALCACGTGTAPSATKGQKETVTVHAWVLPDWTGLGCWAWSSDTGKDAFEAWPGKTMIPAGEWYTVEVPSWVNYIIINGNGGAVQTGDLPVEPGKDLWVIVGSPENALVCYEEPDLDEIPALAEWIAPEELLTTFDSASIIGGKAIAIVCEDPEKMYATYSYDFVPEALRTDNLKEVRYIIRIVKDQEQVGTYTNGGGWAFKHCFRTLVIDLKENVILNTTNIYGGEPPYEVSGSNVKHYGSEPEAETIIQWAREQIQRGATEESRPFRISVHVQVPDSWVEPFCVTSVEKNRQKFKRMEPDGQWYRIDVPGWANTEIGFSSNPELGNFSCSEMIYLHSVYHKQGIWLIVSEDGEIRVDYSNH